MFELTRYLGVHQVIGLHRRAPENHCVECSPLRQHAPRFRIIRNNVFGNGIEQLICARSVVDPRLGGHRYCKLRSEKESEGYMAS